MNRATISAALGEAQRHRLIAAGIVAVTGLVMIIMSAVIRSAPAAPGASSNSQMGYACSFAAQSSAYYHGLSVCTAVARRLADAGDLGAWGVILVLGGLAYGGTVLYRARNTVAPARPTTPGGAAPR
jgi:hypothetical protein